MKKPLNYFSGLEILLWTSSVVVILIAFVVFDGEYYLSLIASLVGVTSLIFNAKGNPFGQFLMIIFSLIYGVISYGFDYYGEMLTYLGMTMPMAVLALVSWLRNPYEGNRAEVKVNKLTRMQIVFMCLMSVAVTAIFYFILKYFNTANLGFSTLSVTTSFLAVFLTFFRSPYYALAYAANDVVLIILWCFAAVTDARYISVTVCFSAFLINDIYGFVSWQIMKKRQAD